MNTHYGVTSPELAQQKFRLIALDLLQNDLSAKITPYGVVYENDFWLDEVYDGKRFIGYGDRDCMMELDNGTLGFDEIMEQDNENITMEEIT